LYFGLGIYGWIEKAKQDDEKAKQDNERHWQTDAAEKRLHEVRLLSVISHLALDKVPAQEGIILDRSANFPESGGAS
jgi:hypothetical protein